MAYFLPMVCNYAVVGSQVGRDQAAAAAGGLGRAAAGGRAGGLNRGRPGKN